MTEIARNLTAFWRRVKTNCSGETLTIFAYSPGPHSTVFIKAANYYGEDVLVALTASQVRELRRKLKKALIYIEDGVQS